MDPTTSSSSHNLTTAAYRAWFLRAKGPIACSTVKRHSRGIWFGENPTDDAFMKFLLQLAIINLLSYTLHFLLRPLKQSKLVCSFLAGLIMSPNMMGHSKLFRKIQIWPEEMLLVRTVGYLGAMYVIFTLAVKTEYMVIMRNFRKAAVIGASGVFTCFFTLLALSFVFDLPGVKKGFFRMLFGIGMSVTRFPSVAHTFDEMNIMTSELGELAVSCTMISEILGWSGYLVGLYLRFPSNQELNLVWAMSVPILFYVGFRPAIQYIARRSPGGIPVKETYVLTILLGSLVAGLLCDLVGSMQLGFLVAGLMVPNGPPVGATLTEKTELGVMELLFPLYFVSIGNLLDFSQIQFKAAGEIFVLVMVSALAKFTGGAASAYFICSLRFSESVLLGLMLVIKGPYDLALYVRWTAANEIMKAVFTALAMSEVIVTMIVTPLIRMFYSPHARLSAPTWKNARFLIATSQNHELRVICCVHSEDDVPGVISLLEASSPTKGSPIFAHVLHMNELIGQATPGIHPYDERLRYVKSNGSSPIMGAFENYAMSSNGMVRLRPYLAISSHRSMHEFICRLALQEHIPLIIIPFQANRQVSSAELTTTRGINSKVQAYSPCTVGLLFSNSDRRLSLAANYFTSIAIVFITGNDDRAALALGIRMTGHPKLRVTLIRIVIAGWQCTSVKEKAEKKLDDLMVSQFVAERGRNERVGYHEFVAENHEQVMKWMRELGGGHDLIVVGRKRRRTTELMDEETMMDWIEYPELGVLGDLIASAEYSSGTSVLVMQHFGDVYVKARSQLNEDDAIHLLKLNS
ncbi:hypothetical protein MLD38_024120 [Melastoma candidum]|uniref:Uncharacterized protein n=1 Tax=Melastoma candidum TaxID=119954 RepID=A0ACB9NR39_9MYRT|nr:hypothetical protein MLD38_024120 [Melastoma candidum]